MKKIFLWNNVLSKLQGTLISQVFFSLVRCATTVSLGKVSLGIDVHSATRTYLPPKGSEKSYSKDNFNPLILKSISAWDFC